MKFHFCAPDILLTPTPFFSFLFFYPSPLGCRGSDRSPLLTDLLVLIPPLLYLALSPTSILGVCHNSNAAPVRYFFFFFSLHSIPYLIHSSCSSSSFPRCLRFGVGDICCCRCCCRCRCRRYRCCCRCYCRCHCRCRCRC